MFSKTVAAPLSSAYFVKISADPQCDSGLTKPCRVERSAPPYLNEHYILWLLRGAEIYPASLVRIRIMRHCIF
jgi:hypothetical protein